MEKYFLFLIDYFQTIILMIAENCTEGEWQKTKSYYLGEYTLFNSAIFS
jgi:hypothetical protein